MINPFGLIITIVLFKLAQRCKNIPFVGKLPPLLIAGVALIFILKVFHISFDTYNESACYLTFLLFPATVALGYPLYKHSDILVKNKRVVYSAFAFASLFAIVITYVTAKLCNVDSSLIISMLPKSVTAPIAVEISKQLGGVPELTACVVVLTGVCGALTGHKILELIRVKNDVAIGLSIGAASHVIGTSCCIEKGREKQVVMSTLALVIVGVLTSVFAPLFLHFIR